MNCPVGASTRRTSSRKSRQFSRCSITSKATTRSKVPSGCGSAVHGRLLEAQVGQPVVARARTRSPPAASRCRPRSSAVLRQFGRAVARAAAGVQHALAARQPRGEGVARQVLVQQIRLHLAGDDALPRELSQCLLSSERLRPLPSARVHLHPAGQVQISVDLALGAAHLQRHGVIDPVAHRVARQRAVGDRRRKGKRCRIQLRQLDVEIHRVDVARAAWAAVRSLRAPCWCPKNRCPGDCAA